MQENKKIEPFEFQDEEKINNTVDDKAAAQRGSSVGVCRKGTAGGRRGDIIIASGYEPNLRAKSLSGGGD